MKQRTDAELRALVDAGRRELEKRGRKEAKRRERVEKRIEKITYKQIAHGDLPSVRPGEKPKKLIPGRTKKKTERTSGERFGLLYYKDAVKKLRRLGVAGFDAEDIPLRDLKTDHDLDPRTARKIEKKMGEYDHLFARPHKVVRIKNKKKREAAQKFGGHFKLEPKLKGAVIPVASRDAKKSKLRFKRETGEPYVSEWIAGQETETYDVPLDRIAMARSPVKYLESLLVDFSDGDRFVIGAGSSVINQSLSKRHLIDHVAGLMKRYDEKTMQGSQLVYAQNNWRNWLLSLKREHIKSRVSGRGFFSAIDLERGAASAASRATRAELMAEQRRQADAERKKRVRLTKRMRLKGRQ